MAVNQRPPGGLQGLSRSLVQEGLLAEDVALKAVRDAQLAKVPFVAWLVANRLCSSSAIALNAARAFAVPLIDLDAIEIDPEITKRVKHELLQKHHVLPLYLRGRTLFVGVLDPAQQGALDELRFQLKFTPEPVVVECDKLVALLEKLADANGGLGALESTDGEFDLGELDTAGGEQEEAADESEVDDAPVVRFVNRMLIDAIKRGASDLHFEPYEKFYRVRFRVDGELSEIFRPPSQLAGKIAARIKVMARLDLAERRVPQDGRIKLKLSKNKAIDFRVSTCPTLWGEKAVMRILDSDSARLGIDMLGYEEAQKALFLKNLHKPYGMFLVTGPTGSGKTVSLYTGINLLNNPDINISTAEDPVEIQLPGVNQVQVDEKTGMTFAKALKSFLRQDPDVILVGEIRDLETASIAVKAAQTGHMVMSTLHTNDAPQTLTRLQDMGVPPFAVATTINIIVAQRLARRLCRECMVVDEEITPDQLGAEGFTEEEIATGFKVFKARGCERCNNGYKGRTGIYQVLPITDALRRLIMSGANAVELADQAAREGIPDLRRSALTKVRNGVTSLEEINSVTLEG
ncbi:MAG TPA: type IV-A pilus assembly ATPase PilB [Gammaproteobacteria bacterium]|nr:type IV-A pilus assembly ATPase PilB [Gammaproteobacteria bacterium]